MKLILVRQKRTATYTLGELFVDGKHFGYTCEDTDRHLETGGVKVYGETCIPSGKYKVRVTTSARFHKELPILENVPSYDGVRIHGGNTAADTLGCILLGSVLTFNGVRDCAERVSTLTQQIKADPQETWIEIIG